METERHGHPLVLNINIYRRPDGSLGHEVYQKSTHTDLYLNPGSQHHPSNIQAVFITLLQRAKALCDKESLHDELEFLKTTFRKMVVVSHRYDRPSTWWLEPLS
jgi:hypothetical protein